MIPLVGIGGREFSAGRLAGCRSPIAVSTLTVLWVYDFEKENSWESRENPAQ